MHKVLAEFSLFCHRSSCCYDLSVIENYIFKVRGDKNAQFTRSQVKFEGEEFLVSSSSSYPNYTDRDHDVDLRAIFWRKIRNCLDGN